MQQLNPKSVWLFFISFLLRSLPFLVFLSIAAINFTYDRSSKTFEQGVNLIVLIPLLSLIMAFMSWVWANLSYKYYKYELKDDGFRKEYGVIWKKYATIPYDRIQNVDINRGLIARLLGLSDLQIQTAGGISNGSYGAFSEGRLPGLSREVAEQMRDELVKRVRHSKGQGL